MNKRNIIIISIILIILIILVGLIFLGRSTEKDDTETNGDSFSSLGSDNRDGVSRDSNNQGDVLSNNQTGTTSGFVLPKLRRISFKETSGFEIFGEGASTTIRYIDSETGNVFEANFQNSALERITNTTILQTINSNWLDKESVVIQYIDENREIQTFSAKIEPSEEDEEQPSSLVGLFWERGIEQIDVLDGEILALIKNGDGSSIIISDPELENQRIVLNTPLEEILVSFISKDRISVNTKPSNQSDGYLYELNKQSGNLSEILFKERGLNSIVSGDGLGVIYSVAKANGVDLWYLNRKSGEVKKVGKNTLSDKCVWDDSNEDRVIYCAVPRNINFRNLPDDWYKGIVSFSDDIWMINLETNETKMIGELEDEFDVSLLKINDDGKYLVFSNKSNKNIWGIDLNKN